MKAVILAGGGGTRLWPLSTPQKPKQFQKLIGNKTMLQETINRLDFLNPKDIFIATNKQHVNLVKKLCSKIPSKNIISESALRDTAPCIGLAAAIIAKHHPKEIMAVIYADHLIKNKKEFQQKLKLAEKIAKKEHTLNIIEVPAKEPNTHYGYVKLGKALNHLGNNVYQLDSFKEKPNQATAKKFVKSGKYLWNTGIYVWETATLLAHYKKLKPDTYKILQKIVSTNNLKLYEKLEKISIDYAIMEKVPPSQVRIIKANLGWSDIGNFEALWHQLAATKTSNITRGPVKTIDCQGCLIYADNKKQISAVGLKDLIIVDTPDGTLICNKQASRKVKDLQKC